MTRKITVSEWRAMEFETMSEKEFQDQHVVPLAKGLGWMIYHTFDSRRSEPGFPDLVLLRRGRLLVRELKSEKGKVTAAQKKWLSGFSVAGISAEVWRPSDWADIVATLK